MLNKKVHKKVLKINTLLNELLKDGIILDCLTYSKGSGLGPKVDILMRDLDDNITNPIEVIDLFTPRPKPGQLWDSSQRTGSSYSSSDDMDVGTALVGTYLISSGFGFGD